MSLRLQKFLRDILGSSRRKAEEMIQNCEIMINGVTAKLGDQVDEENDKVSYKGRVLNYYKKLEYIMLNKPAGYVTSKEDPHEPYTVYEFLPEELHHLSPVGRLDKDTEGLLLFTNDGDFAYQMTHPKFEVEKEYEVVLLGTLQKEDQKIIEKGLQTEEIQSAPCKINIGRQENGKTFLTITIHEGQKREIKRIFKTFHLHVAYLRRIRMAHHTLGNLKPGTWKKISPQSK